MPGADMDFAHVSVLIIEDSSFVRTLVKKILLDMGVREIREAEDGSTGLQMCEQKPPDVVLCDLSMEPMDGFEFVRLLRDHDKMSLRNIPVIVLTTHAEADFVQQAMRCGIEAYLLKPASPGMVKERITRVLSGKARASAPAD
jgi:two-component system chemotaxis response regulator CheY